MKKWKQFLTAALCSTMLLSSFATVSAAEHTRTTNAQIHYVDVPVYQTGAISTYNTANTTMRSALAKQALYDGLMQAEDSIDLSSYNLTSNQFMEYFSNILNTSPELFYVNNSIGWSTSGSTGQVLNVRPNYNASGTELKQMKSTYQKKLSDILALVDSDWSKLEQITFLHDYLAQNFSYDTIGLNNDNAIYDAYGFLTAGKGVCQAYTLTYIALLKELGINVSVASSDTMQHIWNVVELNGKWYHIDVTWDDPVPDSFGNANHNNLLLSDAAISKNNHSNWSCEYQCSDTTYDNYFWTQFSTPFKELSGSWYTIGFNDTASSSYLYSCDLTAQTTSKVYDIGKWYSSGSSYWTSSFSGLNVYGNKLYFNSASSIMSYDPADKSCSAVYTPVSGSIYGMQIKGSELYYNNKADLNSTDTILSYQLPLLPDPEPSKPLSPGDLDNDNQITLNDAILALKGVLHAYPLSNAQQKAADVDGVNGLTLNDVQLLVRVSLSLDTLSE